MPTATLTSAGANAITDGNIVKEATIRYIIENHTSTAADWIVQAMDTNFVATLPALWSALPSYPALRLVSYRSSVVNPTTAAVDCRFVNTGIEVVRGGSGIETFQTDKYPVDQPGGIQADTPITVFWDGAGLPSPPVIPAEHQTQSGVITATDVQTSLVVTRIEPDIDNASATGGINPEEIAANYVNTTNVTDWNDSVQGVGAPGSWLCEDVSFDPNGMDGIAWLMTYSFRHRRNGWDQEAVYIWRETGEPAPMLRAAPQAEPLGRRIIRVNGQTEFNSLAFTFLQ